MKFSELSKKILKEAKILAQTKDEDSIDVNFLISTINKEFDLHIEHSTKEDGERFLGVIKIISGLATSNPSILIIYLDPITDLKLEEEALDETKVKEATKKWLDKNSMSLIEKYKKAAEDFDSTLNAELNLINCKALYLNNKKIK